MHTLAGPIYSIEDMMSDDHYNARGLFEEVEVDGESLKIPAIMPKLQKTPGLCVWDCVHVHTSRR